MGVQGFKAPYLHHDLVIIGKTEASGRREPPLITASDASGCRVSASSDVLQEDKLSTPFLASSSSWNHFGRE
jgi:hypothetical protein